MKIILKDRCLKQGFLKDPLKENKKGHHCVQGEKLKGNNLPVNRNVFDVFERRGDPISSLLVRVNYEWGSHVTKGQHNGRVLNLGQRVT